MIWNWQVSLSGHLFDKFLINEALDIIEAAGGSFHLVKCQVGQITTDLSYSELEVTLFLTLFYLEREGMFIKHINAVVLLDEYLDQRELKWKFIA